MPYCGKCGKWLEEGEICTCETGGETPDPRAGFDSAHMYRSDYPYTGNPVPDPGRRDGYSTDPGIADESPNPGMYNGGGAGYGPYTGPDYGPDYGPNYGPAGGGAGTGKGRSTNASDVIEGIAPMFARLIGVITSFWIRFKNRVGLGEPETNDVDYYERNLEIVPQCIDPDSGEMPIKQYDMAVLRTRLILSRAEGRLQVTNKRVIFRATGRSLMGRTTLQHEFAIDEIAGIKIRKDHRFSFLNYLGVAIVIALGYYFGTGIINSFFEWGMPNVLIAMLALFITALSFVPFFMLYKKFPLKLFLISIGFGMLMFERNNSVFMGSKIASKLWCVPLFIVGLIVLFISWIICWVPNLIVNIETKGTQPAVEIRRKESGILNLFRKPEYTGFAEVLPWRDTELAIIELWAMVSDIQKYGDEAIKQWKK